MANNDSFTQPNAVDTKVFLERAQRYCATAERCEMDVEQLLTRLNASPMQIDEVIGILKEQSYLDDSRYCRAFVHDKVVFQGWGRVKIIMGLRAKRLPETDIQEAISDIDEQTYAANLRKAMQSKRGLDRQKLTRFLLQRGYTFDDLRHCANYETDD